MSSLPETPAGTSDVRGPAFPLASGSALSSRATRISITPRGEPLYSELCTHVEIDDEANGEYIVIRQPGGRADKDGVAINPEEWPQIRAAVEALLRTLRPQPTSFAPLHMKSEPRCCEACASILVGSESAICDACVERARER